MEDLKDTVVAITGASAGIGRATARELARAGARVILGARRRDRLEALEKEFPGQAVAVEMEPIEKARRLRDADVDLVAPEQEKTVRKCALRNPDLGVET